MSNQSIANHPDITETMLHDIDEIIDSHRRQPGAVIPVLRKSQRIVGYLPTQLIAYIANGLGLPTSDVFGVASFYSLFSFKPRGRYTIKACLGTACYVKGMNDIVKRIESEYGVAAGETSEDRRFSFETVRCLGACGLAPVMVVNEDTHGDIAPDNVTEILNQYQ
jgi:NADH:ubiquinone oxidoreductase subunit E